MADDFLLLQHFPQPDTLRFRHYGWVRPAFSFGYRQKFAWVRKRIALPAATQLCRRPTGGGIVDHHNDWTYSLVIPPHHPFFRKSAIEVYRLVHDALTGTLQSCGQSAGLVPCLPCSHTGYDGKRSIKENPDLCFENLASYDVVVPLSGRKLAGAALKRTRQGLLWQGSIDKAVASSIHNWAIFLQSFLKTLSQRLQAVVQTTSQPAYLPEIEKKGKALFYSKQWNDQR